MSGLQRVGVSLFTLIAIAFNLVWWYAAHRNRLLGTGHDGGGQAVTRRYMLGPLLYLVATGIAFFSVMAALLICVAMALFFALPYRPPGIQSRGG